MDSRKILSDLFSPILKEQNFKKKVSTWYLVNDEVIGVLNIQKSQYSDLCYLNIGLYIRKDEPSDFLPNQAYSHIHLRFESLLSDSEKEEILRILTFENRPSFNDLENIKNILNIKILPFLSYYSSKTRIKEAINTRNEGFWKMVAYDGSERLR